MLSVYAVNAFNNRVTTYAPEADDPHAISNARERFQFWLNTRHAQHFRLIELRDGDRVVERWETPESD